GGGMRLAHEARLSDSVQAVGGQEKLQRNRSSEARILGAIDDPHPTGAKRLAYLEVRDGASGSSEWIGSRIRRRAEGDIDARELRACLCIGGEEGLGLLALFGAAACEKRPAS